MSRIIELCGNYPKDFEKIDFNNNPNYIFINDPTYQSRQLFDSEGNTVFVNSFVECEHYVAGGWDFTPIQTNEIAMQNNLFFVVLSLILFTYFLRKKKFINYVKTKK